MWNKGTFQKSKREIELTAKCKYYERKKPLMLFVVHFISCGAIPWLFVNLVRAPHHTPFRSSGFINICIMETMARKFHVLLFISVSFGFSHTKILTVEIFVCVSHFWINILFSTIICLPFFLSLSHSLCVFSSSSLNMYYLISVALPYFRFAFSTWPWLNGSRSKGKQWKELSSLVTQYDAWWRFNCLSLLMLSASPWFDFNCLHFASMHLWYNRISLAVILLCAVHSMSSTLPNGIVNASACEWRQMLIWNCLRKSEITDISNVN